MSFMPTWGGGERERERESICKVCNLMWMLPPHAFKVVELALESCQSMNNWESREGF